MKNFFNTPISEEAVEIGLGTGKDQLIFAVETSCDETAAAVVLNGRKVLSSAVASQIDTHREYGGVIPEIAARMHLESANAVIEEAKQKAGIEMGDVTAFAGTVGPGLVGALLVGLNAAKALSLTYDKPFIGVNHLNAHVCANYLESELEPPFICLLVSGGHTQLIRVKSYTEQEIIGETIDDAVGEAYDKVARLLDLPYPGGPHLDKLAKQGNKEAFKFPTAHVADYDFSFSGLKTSVLYTCKKFTPETLPKADIAASFQEVVSETLLKKTVKAAEAYNTNKIAIAGGVAANSEIRRKFFDLNEKGFAVCAPEFRFCTDNAAMIASAAYFGSNIIKELDAEVFSRM